MENFTTNRKSLNRQNQQMTLKHGRLFCMQRDFIYRHHGDSSVQLHVPKEETFSIPLKAFDVKGTLTQIWTSCKRSELTTIGMWIRTEVCQIRGLVFTIFTLLNLLKIYVVWVRRGEDWLTDKSSDDSKTRSRVARSVDRSQQSSTKTRKTRSGEWEAEARERAQNERNLFYWSGRQRIWRDYRECKKKVGCAYGSGHTVQG